MLTLLVDIEPEQAQLLAQVCDGGAISEAELRAEGAMGTAATESGTGKRKDAKQAALF